MIKIGIQDLENIFKNTRIRFQKEFKKSDDVYLEILLDEIQNYFNNLDTFSFDDKVFLTKDKILSLKKYLYTLASISGDITLLYKKSNQIINELDKLTNLNLYERNTIIKKLSKIHNFIVSHTITSEQNVDSSITFRESFTDNSMQDTSSENISIDNVAGVLKLAPQKVTNVFNSTVKNIRISLQNRGELGRNIFPVQPPNLTGSDLSISDLYGIEGSLYFGKDQNTLMSYLSDNENEGNQLTSCPFEIVHTNPIGEDALKQLTSQADVKLGKIELNEDYSFLKRYLNTEELLPGVPEVILEISMSTPVACSYIDLKFDNEIPSLMPVGSFLKGNAYDNTTSYPLVNLDPFSNKLNFPYTRIYWGKVIYLSKLQINLKCKWINVPINIIKWQTNLSISSTTNQNLAKYKAQVNVGYYKIFFTEQFDPNVYNKVTGERKTETSLVTEIQKLSESQQGILIKV